MDHGDDDLYFDGNKDINYLMKKALLDYKCMAFNSLGYFKHNVDINNLKTSGYFKQGDGLYVKKNFKKIIRIKFIFNLFI